jgi:1,4-dihydroxy-2-naphthoyl-CoA hydrolase
MYKDKTKEEILAFINNWGDETFAKTLEIKFTDIDLKMKP